MTCWPNRPIAEFFGDKAGAVAIQFGLSAVVLGLVVGGAIDMGRWLHAKRVTVQAVDSAVLAAARHLQLNPNAEAAALAAARSYYDTNVTKRFVLESDTITFITADSGRSITATGEAYIKTTLLNLAGIDRMLLTSSSGAGLPKARFSVGGPGGSSIEVALMLDVTGSMCDDGNGPCTSGTKISGLKDAAKQLIDMVVADQQSPHYSKVAVIPFSTRVRVGPDAGGGARMKALTNLDPFWSGWYNQCTATSGGAGATSENGGSWQCTQYQVAQMNNWRVLPCVTDRFYNASNSYDYTEDAPGSGRWLNAHDGSRMPLGPDSSSTAATSALGVTQSDPAYHWNYDSAGVCADVAQANEILPLTSDKTSLKDRIDGLQALGATSGALGTAFAWYMLSPNWSSVWTGDSAPASYTDLTSMQPNGAPRLRKVAILMSDGVYNTVRGWKDQDQQTVSNHAKQLCTNMKAQGIEIFTVGLQLDQLSSSERAIAEDTLRTCGTDISHFYSTLTVGELQVAFQDIGSQLSSLYLSR